jgi:HK97 family phage major capsid protein
MSKLTDLIERKNSLIANATQMVQAGLKTSEAKEQYRKILADVDDADEMISMLKRVEPFLNVPAPVVPVAATRDRRESKKQRKANLSNAYRHYLRHGSQPGAPEQRALLTSSGSAGALIPQEFDSVVYDALKYWGPIATMVTHRNDNNRPQKFTVSDDASATMSYISESGDSTATAADPTLVSYVPATDALVTTVKYSMQMLEDANSFESFIRDIAGLRCARSIEYCLTIGKDNGTNTALPNSPVGGLLGSVSTGATTSTLAAGIGYSDLSNLAASVDHAYYVNGSFMASPSVFQYLLGQKDSTSRPFYNIDPDTGLLMINGKKLIVNAAMPAYNAASSPVVLFGDFSRAYAYVGTGISIQVLRERYIDTFEGAAVIHHRLGATKIVSGAVKSLVTAAA